MASSIAIIKWPFIALFSNIVRMFIYLIMPVKGKRIIYIVSLYTHLKHIDLNKTNPMHLEIIKKQLNELFVLSELSVESLNFPIFMNQFIWGSFIFPSPEVISHRPTFNTAEKIANSVPYWIKYDKCIMEDDTEILLRKYLGRMYLYGRMCNK